MQVLVTGGAGFIGTHVVRELLSQGHEVTVLDSLISGARSQVPPEAHFIEGDIRDMDVVRDALAGTTHVVHLAALVSVPKSIEDPEETFDVNVAGMRTVLEAAVEQGIQGFVYASSASVYGNEPTLPKHEDMLPDPQSPYASSKIEDERIAGEVQALSPIGLRFFNVYGPGQRGDHPYASVVPRWIEAIKKGKPIELYGDGTQTRDFIHVRDIARAVVTALTVRPSGPTVCNIASGTEVSLRSLLTLIEEAYGSEVTVIERSPRPGDIMRSVAAIERARTVLGFTPTISLEEGVRELVI